MKNTRLLIMSLVLAVSLTLLCVPLVANAETRKEGKRNLTSELNLVNYNAVKTVHESGTGKDRIRRQLRGILVPLKEGVKAFCDFTPPVAHGLEAIGIRKEYRAVIGFHFRLK